MSKNQWENLGEDILNSVFEAADTGDFSNLSRNVEDLVNVTFDTVGGAVKEGIHQVRQKQSTYDRQKKDGAEYYNNWREQQRQRYQQAVNNPEGVASNHQGARLQRQGESRKASALRGNTRVVRSGGNVIQTPALYKKNVPGKYSGPLLTVFGGIGTGIGAAITLGLGIAVLNTGIMGLGIATGVLAAVTAGFVVMTGGGTKISGRNQRFKTYVKCLGDKSYCKIEELATAVGKSSKYVVKDVRKMMSMGYFLQGHMDPNETLLITSNEAYEQYTQAEVSRIEREAEERKLEAEAKHPRSKAQKLIREGEKYIAHIHECNVAIPGVEMTAKLQRLEDTMRRIFEHLKTAPESADDLDKMMKYYLPTTTKLIDTYKELDAKPEIGDNIKNTKKEIEGTLDTINDAFEKIFDDMFLNTAWDISSDISVMKTMMAQEGLTETRMQ